MNGNEGIAGLNGGEGKKQQKRYDRGPENPHFNGLYWRLAYTARHTMEPL